MFYRCYISLYLYSVILMAQGHGQYKITVPLRVLTLNMHFLLQTDGLLFRLWKLGVYRNWRKPHQRFLRQLCAEVQRCKSSFLYHCRCYQPQMTNTGNCYIGFQGVLSWHVKERLTYCGNGLQFGKACAVINLIPLRGHKTSFCFVAPDLAFPSEMHPVQSSCVSTEFTHMNFVTSELIF